MPNKAASIDQVNQLRHLRALEVERKRKAVNQHRVELIKRTDEWQASAKKASNVYDELQHIISQVEMHSVKNAIHMNDMICNRLFIQQTDKRYQEAFKAQQQNKAKVDHAKQVVQSSQLQHRAAERRLDSIGEIKKSLQKIEHIQREAMEESGQEDILIQRRGATCKS